MKYTIRDMWMFTAILCTFLAVIIYDWWAGTIAALVGVCCMAWFNLELDAREQKEGYND